MQSMRKSEGLWLGILLLLLLTLVSQGAWAQFPNPPPIPQPFPPIDPVTGTICPVASGVASRVITCIHDTVLWAVMCFLLPFSAAVSDAVRACCVIAVCLFGASAFLGRNYRLTSDAVILG